MPDNLSDFEENRLLDLSIVAGDYVALMTAGGSDAVAGTEVTGGGYGRAAAAFGAANSGSKTSTSPHLYINMPATQVQAWAIYNASSAGARKWYGLFNPRAATAQAAGDTITTGVPHGLANNGLVVFQYGFTPAGLQPNFTYYVVGATTSTFQVATTSGGAAVDITGDNAQVVVGDVITCNAGEVFAIPSGSLILSLS